MFQDHPAVHIHRDLGGGNRGAAHFGFPLEDGGDTQVRYLRYADSEELATKLQQHFTAQVQQAASGAAPAAGAVATRAPSSTPSTKVGASSGRSAGV